MVSIALAAGSAWAAGRPEIKVEPDAVVVHTDEQVMLRYRYGDVDYKPYVDRFATPGGVNVLRDAPWDHKHHHALMFAVKVDGVNFWEEQPAHGSQVHRSITEAKVDEERTPPQAGLTDHIEWVEPESGKVLLKERRTIGTCQVPDLGASLLTWESRFELPAGKKSAELTGAHYHGLGMRFLVSMDKGGRFRNAAGEVGEAVRGDESLARARWCAYSANADGKPVTVAMFDHPDNPRHPAWWFTMLTPFSYMSATLNLHRDPLKMTGGEPVHLRYGVALWDGGVEDGQVEGLYRRWLEMGQ